MTRTDATRKTKRGGRNTNAQRTTRKWIVTIIQKFDSRTNVIFVFDIAAESSALFSGPRRSGARNVGSESRIAAEDGRRNSRNESEKCKDCFLWNA